MSDLRDAKYSELALLLGEALGQLERGPVWFAKHTYVSRESARGWLAGKTRPAPYRVGLIAALLDLDPDELATLARYMDAGSRAKVIDAYGDCCRVARKGGGR